MYYKDSWWFKSEVKKIFDPKLGNMKRGHTHTHIEERKREEKNECWN